MKETADNIALDNLCKKIESEAGVLTKYIHNLPPSDLRITAINLPIEGKDYTVLSPADDEKVINAYSQFKAKIDQDPSRPLRLPGVIQIATKHKVTIVSMLNEINSAKSAFETLYIKMTKGLEPRKRAKRVHDALGSSAYITLQITRSIPFLTKNVIYSGITYHKKPNIVSLTKTELLNRLTAIEDRPTSDFTRAEWSQLLKESRDRIELLNEEHYSFRYTKGSYYRPMVNVKCDDGSVLQPSASIPVIIFGDKFIKVNLPRKHDNAKRRSDRVYDPECPNLSFANIHIKKRV